MTAPLVPAKVNLRNFPYMPLDVLRLRDSSLAAVASAEEFRAAVLLWCASWHQQPAASLPEDDVLLAALAGYGRDVEGWARVKAGALRGFAACSDGRLYHPVIAQKAIEAWVSKLRSDRLREDWRKRKERSRAGVPRKSRGSPVEIPGDVTRESRPRARVTDTKQIQRITDTDTKQIQNIKDPRADKRVTITSNKAHGRRRLSAERDDFDQFRSAYPPRNGTQPWARAKRAINARIKEGHTWAEIIAGAGRYARWCQATGKLDTEHVLQAATFCGPDKGFLQPWEGGGNGAAPVFPYGASPPDPEPGRYKIGKDGRRYDSHVPFAKDQHD